MSLFGSISLRGEQSGDLESQGKKSYARKTLKREDPEDTSYLGAIQSRVQGVAAATSGYAGDLRAQTQMYPYFALVFGIGCLFLFLSLWFLPMIVVAPRKCANLFNMGSICILSSFAILRGPY